MGQWVGELGLAWGEGGVGGFVGVFSIFVLRFNLTRDLSRYVRIPLRSPPDPFVIVV